MDRGEHGWCGGGGLFGGGGVFVWGLFEGGVLGFGGGSNTTRGVNVDLSSRRRQGGREEKINERVGEGGGGHIRTVTD